jgi:hypothetical protein
MACLSPDAACRLSKERGYSGGEPDELRSSRMKLRRVIFWLHLAAGMTAGVIILAMSITGVLCELSSAS